MELRRGLRRTLFSIQQRLIIILPDRTSWLVNDEKNTNISYRHPQDQDTAHSSKWNLYKHPAVIDRGNSDPGYSTLHQRDRCRLGFRCFLRGSSRGYLFVRGSRVGNLNLLLCRLWGSIFGLLLLFWLLFEGALVGRVGRELVWAFLFFGVERMAYRVSDVSRVCQDGEIHDPSLTLLVQMGAEIWDGWIERSIDSGDLIGSFWRLVHCQDWWRDCLIPV
jgi:hypothetical protein